MKNLVLKDIAPSKVESLTVFLKEMNSFTFLVTSGNGPLVSAEKVQLNEATGMAAFGLSEGGYETVLKAKVNQDRPEQVNFMINEGEKCLFQAKYTLGNTPYYALQVILNCDSEGLIKEELIRSFQRDFSAEAHVDMGKSLEELRAKEKTVVPEVEVEREEEKEHVFEENEALIKELNSSTDQEDRAKEDPVEAELEDDREVSIELEQLSENVLGAINETKIIIEMLNNIAYDMTRGRSVDFTGQPVNQEELENGAKIEMVDVEGEEYRITFRKGKLEGAQEVSFFLEQGDQLIFSVYLSSDGYGKISAEGRNGEQIIQQIKMRLS